MSDFRRQRVKSAPYDLRRTWHGTSHTDEAHVPQIKQASDQTKDAFRQKDIGIQLVRLTESVKRCSNHWGKKFSSAKKSKKEDHQQTIFIDQLNSLLSDFENFKKALPPEVLGLTRDGKQYQRDSTEASPSPFLLRRDRHEAAGGFEQFRKDPIEVKPAPLHQEDTGRFKQPKRDPNEDILKQFQQRLDVLEMKLDDTESRCKRAEDKARTLAAEKEDLMTRLSQVSGSKLRDNNPAITAFSDPNRPIKLVEKISELYDNEWTDGMKALEKSGMKESQALKVLLSVFTTSHEMCMEIARINIDNLQRQLSNPTNRQESHDDRMRDVPSHALKQLKNARKVAADYQVGIPAIIQEVDRVLANEHGHRVVQSCRKYIDRCVEYSWYMSIQDPPLEIEYQYTIGGKFEHDKMRAYTMSGKYVEYVVWPAIYLQKGGALLSKAVVKCQIEAVNACLTHIRLSRMDSSERIQSNRIINENISSRNRYAHAVHTKRDARPIPGGNAQFPNHGGCDHSASSSLNETRVALISQALSGKNEWENCIIRSHGKAEWKCINCGDFYCVECKDHHAMGAKTGLHRLLPFSEKDTEEAVRKEVFCRHHEERELDMFCVTDKMPICAQCEAAIEHRGHEITTMVKYAENTRYEVGSTLTKADKLIPEFENKLEKIATAKKQIDANDEHVDIIVKETITKFQQTALNLKTVEKKKMKILEKREEKITKERSSVTLKVLETRKFLENCSKNEIVRQGQGFIEDLEAVIKDCSSESEIQITQLTREEIYQQLKKI